VCALPLLQFWEHGLIASAQAAEEGYCL